MWAITPHGAGRPVGARRIKPDWELAEGEAFTVEDHEYSPGMVLGEDGESLEAAPAPEPRYFVFEDLLKLLDGLPANAKTALRQAVTGNNAVFAFWQQALSKGKEPIDMQGNTFPQAWAALTQILSPAIGQQGVDDLLAALTAKAAL